MAVAPTNVFGPLVTAADVEQAVVDTLRTWINTYLLEMERRTGREEHSVARPRSWQIFNDFDQLQGDQLPLVVVVSPGFADAPEKTGGGVYDGWWRIGVGVLATAVTKPAAREVAHLYGACVRAILVHKASSVTGGGGAYRLEDEAYTDAETDYPGWTALVTAAYQIPGIVQTGRGPKEPVDETAPFGLVHEVDIDGTVARDGDAYDPALTPLVREVAP